MEFMGLLLVSTGGWKLRMDIGQSLDNVNSMLWHKEDEQLGDLWTTAMSWRGLALGLGITP